MTRYLVTAKLVKYDAEIVDANSADEAEEIYKRSCRKSGVDFDSIEIVSVQAPAQRVQEAK